MTVTAHNDGVTIELAPDEMEDLAEFLGGFYQGDQSVMDRLSEALDTIIDAKT